jgi:signal transduction histidine kinase
VNIRNKHFYADWLFGGVMFLLCAVLTVLQYRWTGEVANAEMIRLRGNLDQQAHALTRAFDAELSSTCDQLLPKENDENDFTDQGNEAAQLARFKSWQAANPRPIFSRIALGVAEQNNVRLLLLDQHSGRFIRTNWPAEWSALRENLADKITIGSPPFADDRGVLQEFPLHAGPGGPSSEHPLGPPPGPAHSSGERWLITEFDLAYVRDTWFPELVAKYLNPSGQIVNDVSIQAGGYDPSVLYSTVTNNTRNPGTSAVSVRFNLQGKTERNSRGPVQAGRWRLETWQRPGAFEATVAAARYRNLAVAVALNLMMLATGIGLARHTRRSRQLAEQQMNFVAGVSHELRTPLTVIRGAAHNIQRGVVSEPARINKYSSLIVEHCEHLTEMIEQVLTLAGIDKGLSASLRQPVMLAEILNEAITATAHDVQVANCEVHMELPPSLPVITGDPAALRRVFQNLVTNAAKHGGRGGWISVTAITDEEGKQPMVEIQVADCGPGIPKNELSDIFKPFFRGAAARQTRGSGLGLNLVREVVEAHKGSVTVRSENGHGAIFIVRLPVTAPKKQK